MRRSEKGRSMVEMLGVLAIIGVLSVGGIYGYTVAMSKYKANEVVQLGNMMATTALAQAANGTDVQNQSAQDLGLANSGTLHGCAPSATTTNNGLNVTISFNCTAGSDVADAVSTLISGYQNETITLQASNNANVAS